MRRISYVDVLEHVSDGVHVDIVNRRNQQTEVHRSDDKPRRRTTANSPKRNQRRPRR